MNNRAKYPLVAVLITAAIFTYGRNRPASAPSDFRDAPRDTAAGSLKDLDPAGVIGAIKVPDAAIPKPADTEQTNKGFFGDDNRRVTNSKEKPYRLVGRLVKNGVVSCTAFLVSEQVAMTAAHCVEDKGERYKFQYDGGGPWREAKAWLGVNIVSISRGKNYTGDNLGDNILREDFALLKLEKPSPNGWGYFRIADHVVVGQAALAIGFPAVLGDGSYKIVSDNCSVRKLAEDSIYSDCAINRGNSGGPLLVKDGNDEWLLAGVASTQKIFPDKGAAMGEAYSDDIANHFCNITLYNARITDSIVRFK